MRGMDPALVAEFDYGLAIGRIRTDVLTDFIFAPHYSAVFTYVADVYRREFLLPIIESLRHSELIHSYTTVNANRLSGHVPRDFRA